MKYIVHKRFKGTAICGNVNLPATAACECIGDFIIHDGKVICAVKSENAHQHFTRDDDGKGMERGKLTQAIQKALAGRGTQYQARWDKVWSDPLCQPYKREEYADYWLWNHEFFNADINVLRHIANLIGARA